MRTEQLSHSFARYGRKMENEVRNAMTHSRCGKERKDHDRRSFVSVGRCGGIRGLRPDARLGTVAHGPTLTDALTVSSILDTDYVTNS